MLYITLFYLIHRCGSVVVDFIMYFNQRAAVSDVLLALKDAARQEKFGVFKVDPDSIKQISSPTVQGRYITFVIMLRAA